MDSDNYWSFIAKEIQKVKKNEAISLHSSPLGGWIFLSRNEVPDYRKSFWNGIIYLPYLLADLSKWQINKPFRFLGQKVLVEQNSPWYFCIWSHTRHSIHVQSAWQLKECVQWFYLCVTFGIVEPFTNLLLTLLAFLWASVGTIHKTSQWSS